MADRRVEDDFDYRDFDFTEDGFLAQFAGAAAPHQPIYALPPRYRFEIGQNGAFELYSGTASLFFKLRSNPCIPIWGPGLFDEVLSDRFLGDGGPPPFYFGMRGAPARDDDLERFKRRDRRAAAHQNQQRRVIAIDMLLSPDIAPWPLGSC